MLISPLLLGLVNVGGVGPSLSYVQDKVLLPPVLSFPAKSEKVSACIFAVTVPFQLMLLFTVHTATVFDFTTNDPIVQFVTFKSFLSTHCTGSLNVHVTV